MNFKPHRYFPVPFLLLLFVCDLPAQSFSPVLNGFRENKGQVMNAIGKPVPEILFSANFSAFNAFFTENRFSYVLNDAATIMRAQKKSPQERMNHVKKDGKRQIDGCRIDVEFVHSHASSLKGTSALAGYENFYEPVCPNGALQVHSFSSIYYNELYDGIDLEVMYDEQGRMKYNFLIEAGADPSEIMMLYKGATAVTTDGKTLFIENNIHSLSENMPEIWQQTTAGKIPVNGKYVLHQTNEGVLVQFVLDEYDHHNSLVIDPVTWVTYYGGSTDDESTGITADATGNAYICGNSSSTNFPVSPGAFQTTMSTAYDAVLIKFDNAGVRQWATFLGGTGIDYALDVACDHSGLPVVTGNTSSTDFPITVGCFQSTSGGNEDIFISKFNTNGSMNFSTYFGGTDYDSGNGVTVDSQDNIIVSGVGGNGFPVSAGAYQTTMAGLGTSFLNYATYGLGMGDAVIIKLSPSGSRLWATFIGGSDEDFAMAVAADSQDNIIIGGATNSGNFPVSSGCFQSSTAGGNFIFFGVDAFLAKFDANGNRLWATYLGGTDEDQVSGIGIDTQDNILFTGTTASPNFPVSAGCDQAIFDGGYDIFTGKFTPGGSRTWVTYHGTNFLYEWFPAGTTDANDNFYVYYEWEDSFDTLVVLGCAYQKVYGGYEDQFVIKYNASGFPVCSTYLGGPDEEDWDNMWGDISWKGGYLYFCTSTEGGGFPVTPGAFQTTKDPASMFAMVFGRICSASCGDNSATQADFSDTTTNCSMRFFPSVLACDTSQVTYQWSFPGGTPSSSPVKYPPVVTYPISGSYTVQLIVTSPCGSDTIVRTVTSGGTDCDPVITAPNVFTPNGDNMNDGFMPTTIAITQLHYVIYDRWGMKVAEISDLNTAWNGKGLNGKECTDGVYYYVIDATGVNEQVYHLSGFVQLIRNK